MTLQRSLTVIVEPPGIDLWAYGEATGRTRAHRRCHDTYSLTSIRRTYAFRFTNVNAAVRYLGDFASTGRRNCSGGVHVEFVSLQRTGEHEMESAFLRLVEK